MPILPLKKKKKKSKWKWKELNKPKIHYRGILSFFIVSIYI